MSELTNTNEYQKFTTLANFDKYPNLLVWLEKLAEGLNIPSACLMKIELVAEELFANVASYSYPNSSGNIEGWVKPPPNLIDRQFIDSGIEYNPLKKDDPDKLWKEEKYYIEDHLDRYKNLDAGRNTEEGTIRQQNNGI